MGTNVTLDRFDELAHKWGPLLFRVAPLLAAYWMAQAGFLFSKFTSPGVVADVIGGMGAPDAIWFVYFLGIIEFGFILTALFGFYARIFAGFMFVEMIFAWFYGGANPQLMVMFLSAYFIIMFGTGALSIRDPSWADLYDLVSSKESRTDTVGG